MREYLKGIWPHLLKKRSVHETKSIKPHLSSLLLPLLTTHDLLPYNAVIHAVGLRTGEGNEEYKLRIAVRSSLLLASKKALEVALVTNRQLYQWVSTSNIATICHTR